MKPLRHALFAGSLGLLSFVGCSHSSARTPDTTPSPGLQTPATATPAPAQTTGTIHEPISAPVNDPTIKTSPTDSDLGEVPNPITRPEPVSPARTDDSKASDPPVPPLDMTTDPDLTSTPAGNPVTGEGDAGTPPPKAPPRDTTRPKK